MATMPQTTLAAFLAENKFQDSDEALAALLGDDGGLLYGHRGEALLRWGSRVADDAAAAEPAAAPDVDDEEENDDDDEAADEGFEAPAKEGWLQKKGSGFASWKDRYFSLSGTEAAYFADAAKADRKGEIVEEEQAARSSR